jgi:hypothetical protein
MAVLVKMAWPKHLETPENKEEDSGGVKQGFSESAGTPLAGSLPASRVEDKAGLAGS